MDIKYTIEILTKDIQDIEKLVGKLQNSKDASDIELDLAMSKLRNVYEILTMIKADRLKGLLDPSPEDSPSREPEARVAASQEVLPEPEPAPVPEPRVEAEPEPAAPPEPETVPAPEAEATPEAETVQAPVDESKAEEAPAEKEAPPKAPQEQDKDPGILAEKFKAESSIDENMAETRTGQVDSALLGQPIDNIARNIGINDRFLIIRELFDGNSDDFGSLISRLDSAENYDNASKMLDEQFAGSPEHEGVEILAGLVKRRYLR